jgi:hypothetical protein
MKRCLILSCSKSKNQTSSLQPAILRYDGPAFRVFRLFLKKADSSLLNIDLYVLSAQYGLIPGQTPVENYDLRMTPSRAAELNYQTLIQFSQTLKNGYHEVFISMSKDYLRALNGYEGLVPSKMKIVISTTSEGKRLYELKSWLYKQEFTHVNTEKSGIVIGKAVLKGRIIKATRNEINDLAQKSLDAGGGTPFNYKEWYTIINGVKVSPKWLVSLLSGLGVSEFQASDARRVLSQLGISTEHV